MDSTIEKEELRGDGKWYVRIRCKTGDVYDFEFEKEAWAIVKENYEASQKI